MELIIGRESGNSRLQISSDNGNVKYLGNIGSVPKTVSRQHCKLVYQDTSDLLIVNLKPENKTLVNGVAVMQKHITLNDRVELGKDNYLLDLSAIVNASSSQPISTHNSQQPSQTYSLAHLETVWDNYNKAKLNTQIKQAKENAFSSVSGLFSMAAIIAGFIPDIPNVVRILIYIVAFSLAGYFLYSRVRKASYYPKYFQKLDEDFHKEYVCPNPTCHRFLGYQPFDDLRKTKKCFSCGCEYSKS